MSDEASETFDRFMLYLEADPDNMSLMGDAAGAALAAGKLQQAEMLLERLERRAPLSDRQKNLRGLVFMKAGKFLEAIAVFETILASGAQAREVEFNLAWSLSMVGRHSEALEVLKDGAGAAFAEAATLEVQLHHQLADFETARARAEAYAAKFSDHEGLMAAISVLAIDLEALDWAEACARKAGEHPDALASLGTLALRQDDVEGALALFGRSSEIRAHNPRAWIGTGLADMLQGNASRAAENLDKGAQLFEDHLGSWIAAGWAYFIQSDYETARARFQHALELDGNFAESHGSLAVLDVIAGDIDRAEAGARTALRLDRNCFSAALAHSLLASASGKEELAKQIFERALHTPIDEDGRTIAQSLVRLGLQG